MVLLSLDSMKALCCMTFLGKSSSEIIVAGCQNIMFKIDVEHGHILEEVRAFVGLCGCARSLYSDSHKLRVHNDGVLPLYTCRDKHRLNPRHRTRVTASIERVAGTYFKDQLDGCTKQLPRNLRLDQATARTTDARSTG